ncbi:hypothetical protein [Actinoplanes teichomyceticus]|nr:hypothetical protein [Actinoplanes teichomyceticus]
MVLILECRSHLDLGDLPNLLAAELGVMTVRLERAIRSLDGVARVHVNRWGDGSAHLHMWFLARPYGRLQLRGTFLSLWDDILPVIPEHQWRENLALVAAWLAEFGGQANAEPAHIQWESPATLNVPMTGADEPREEAKRPATLGDVQAAAAAADSWVRHSDAPTAGSPPGGAGWVPRQQSPHPHPEDASSRSGAAGMPAGVPERGSAEPDPGVSTPGIGNVSAEPPKPVTVDHGVTGTGILSTGNTAAGSEDSER